VAGLLLSRAAPGRDRDLRWIWPGDVDAASTMLQVIATGAITVITLTFSVTIVALQFASQQFSPRLLRDFMRDRLTKACLSVLVATFVFTVAALHGLRADDAVPTLTMLVALLLGIFTLAAVLGFITHIARALRVDTMMLATHDETEQAIRVFYPAYGDTGPRSPDDLDLDWDQGVIGTARKSGFVRQVDVDELVERVRRHDALVWLVARPGDHVVRGTPLAMLWSPRSAEADELADAVRDAVVVGYERTVEQDAAFGFRQLEDIAVKALSPGINDPVTAAHSIGHMADLLVQLVNCRLGPTLHFDEDGNPRAVVPDRDLRYYLDLACGQVRRYGDREPTVLLALLRMLRDVAISARDENQRGELHRQLCLVLTARSPSLQAEESRLLDQLADQVRAALEGRAHLAYQDRIGETRSV
jgi:uncharacterized membrane protein